MRPVSYLLFFFVGIVYGACRPQEAIEADGPAKTIREAQARLAQKEWVMGEIFSENELIYKRGDSKEIDDAIGIDWYKFHPDGTFEIKYTDFAETEKSRYLVDEANNTIVFTWDDFTSDPLICKIEAGSVYKDQFKFSFSETYDNGVKENYTVTMIIKN